MASKVGTSPTRQGNIVAVIGVTAGVGAAFLVNHLTHNVGDIAATLMASGAAAGAIASIFDIKNRTSAKQQILELAPDSLEQKIEHLLESMRQSATLVEQVSAELDARALTVKRLQEDAKSAQALAELNKEQAEAVQRIIQSGMGTELKATRKDIFRDSVRLAIISFLAGGSISLLITLLVHPLR